MFDLFTFSESGNLLDMSENVAHLSSARLRFAAFPDSHRFGALVAHTPTSGPKMWYEGGSGDLLCIIFERNRSGSITTSIAADDPQPEKVIWECIAQLKESRT